MSKTLRDTSPPVPMMAAAKRHFKVTKVKPDQRWRSLNREQRNHNRALKGLPPLPLFNTRKTVTKSIRGTDVGTLQGAMQNQVKSTGRFHATARGSEVLIKDNWTGKKTRVPLYAARATLEALKELLG